MQAVVGANARQPVFAVTSLTDYLPGSLISNGTPTGPHIDLSLVLGRRLYPTQILAVMGDRYPLGAAGLAAGALALGVVSGLGLIALRGPRGRRPAERLAWLSLGIGLTAMTASLVIRSVGGDPVPESGTDFWTRIAVLVVAVAVVPWSLAALRVFSALEQHVLDGLEVVPRSLAASRVFRALEQHVLDGLPVMPWSLAAWRVWVLSHSLCSTWPASASEQPS